MKFSTNPQRSSQQEEYPFLILEKTLVRLVGSVQMSQSGNPAHTDPKFLGNPYFHRSFPLCGLYTLRKNEYSTLAVLMNRRNR
jgi:hypothetical protein